jgi:hypothetical protein
MVPYQSYQVYQAAHSRGVHLRDAERPAKMDRQPDVAATVSPAPWMT